MNTTTQQERVPAQRNQRGEFKQYLGLDKKFGYLHELRRLPNSNAHTVRLSVPVGQSSYGNDSIKYVSFELFVKHADALRSFFTYQNAIVDDSVKVSVRFSCGNLMPKAYVAQKGEKEGQAIPYIGGNLTYLHSMKVDGAVVHGFNANTSTSEEYVSKETGEVTSSKNGVNTVNNETDEPDSHLMDGPPIEAYENELLEGELIKGNAGSRSEKDIDSEITSPEVSSKPGSASDTAKSQVKRGATQKGKSTTKAKAS